MPHLTAEVMTSALPPEELEKRARRFRAFQVIFVLAYTGIVLDVVTTALGYRQAGATYEQNPLGGLLIGELGWFGMLAVLTAMSLIAYVSCKIIQWSLGGSWARWLNIALAVIAAFRWIAVVTAVLYLIQPGN
jgi:hypothetical protein